MGERTVSKIIKNTCAAIVCSLSPVYLHRPNKVIWRNIARGFRDFWNLPNCIGAINGQHIPIICPNSGSLYYNYKKFYSIVLLALCTHTYAFCLVDIGAHGSERDRGVFARSEIAKALANGTLDIPDGKFELPNSNVKTTYYFVGDAAFGISENMMRPYPGKHLPNAERIFNYRLSIRLDANYQID